MDKNIPTSHGLTTGSIDGDRFLEPLDKPQDVGLRTPTVIGLL